MFKKIPRSHLVSLVLVLALSLSGCPFKRKAAVTNLPIGVTQEQVNNWYTAVGINKFVADTSLATTQTLVGLNRAGTLPDGPEYGAVLLAMGRVHQAGIQASSFLSKVPQKWDLTVRGKLFEYTKEMAGQLKEASDNGLLGIKDPQRREAFVQVITSMENAIKTLEILVGK